MRKALTDKYKGKNLRKQKLEDRKGKLGPSHIADVTDDVFTTIDGAARKALG